MKIVKIALKYNKVSVVPEQPDDLWLLEKIITPGCFIHGKTQRSLIIEKGDKREKVRKNITAKLLVEKITSGNPLRVSGNIAEATDEVPHAYHSFDVSVGKKITIEKQWRDFEIDMLKKARKKYEPLLVCTIDDKDAFFAVISNRVKRLASLQGSGGKQYKSDNSGFYKEVINFIKNKPYEKVIIAGPGFAKEHVFREIKNIKKAYMDSVSSTGISGVYELIKRGTVQKVYKDSEISLQTKLVEDFFERLSKNENVAYGKDEVEKAAEMGAVDFLLVSESVVRENEELLKKTEKMGGKVKIIYQEHDAGQRLFAMGGLAAFLRFSV